MPENPPCHLKEQHTFTRSKDGEAGTNLHGQRPNHEQTHTHTHLPHYMTHDAVDEERTLLWSVATRVTSSQCMLPIHDSIDSISLVSGAKSLLSVQYIKNKDGTGGARVQTGRK